jgi:hypothetical protein
MLLGLPHGFHDGFYGEDGGTGPRNPEHEFVHRCAIIGGKVIGRNISSSAPSFAQAMDLQEQLESISGLLPDFWWDLPLGLPFPGPDLDALRDRLLQQYYYFHVGLYVHLPFLVSPKREIIPGHTREVSRSLCREAARQMLKRYALLRAEVNRASVFDCKTSDFVAFTAALVLHSGLPLRTEGLDHAKKSEDLDLIASVMRIFHRLETADECRIASQCRRVLEVFSGHGGQEGQARVIRIPHFGTIVRRLPTETPLPIAQGNVRGRQSQQAMPRDALAGEMLATPYNYLPSGWSIVDFIDTTGCESAEGNLMEELFMGDPSFVQNQSLFDIDQDWFFHEGATSATPPENFSQC